MSYYKLDTCSTTLSIELFSLIIKDNSYNIPPFIGFSILKCLKDFKSKIEPSTAWDNIKKYTNSFEFIHTNIPNQKISVSKLKPISRAFFKLVEMVNGLNLLEPFKSTDMNCFHLAEGPGGFIEAMTHLRNNKDDKYYGMTLMKIYLVGIKYIMFFKKMKISLLIRGVIILVICFHLLISIIVMKIIKIAWIL